MARIMKRTTALVLALMLILGQIALPVIADDSAASAPPVTHDQVEAKVESAMDNMVQNQTAQTPGTTTVYDGPVQEQIVVPEKGTQNVESTTKATITVDSVEVKAPGDADPKAPVTGQIEIPEHITEFPEGGKVMYDANGNVITTPPAPVVGTEENGGLKEGGWKEVDGAVDEAETTPGQWQKTSEGEEEDVFIYGTYQNINGQLKAEVTSQILVQTGLFTAQEMVNYNKENPVTTIDTLKGLINGKLDALNKDPANVEAGITYVLKVEPIEGTDESRIVIQKFTKTKDANEFKAADGAGVENIEPGEFGDTPVETRISGVMPEYEFDAEKDAANTDTEGNTIVDVDGNVTSYTKTDNKRETSEDGKSTTDTVTTQVIDKKYDETQQKVVYDVKETVTSTNVTERTLQEALNAGIITSESKPLVDENGNPIVDGEGNPVMVPGTKDFVDAKNAELDKLATTTHYYIDPTASLKSDLTNQAPTDSGETVLIASLNEVDANGVLTGKVQENVFLPVLTATGVNKDGYQTTETYTPATLDGNLVYQRVATWVDAGGTHHSLVDYIYGELKSVRESYEFVPDESGAGTVITTTVTTTEQTKHIDATHKEEDYERRSTGTKEYEGTTVGEVCEYSFTAGADGKVYFTLNGDTYALADHSKIVNTINDDSTKNRWQMLDMEPLEFKLGGSNVQYFIVKDEDGVERRVYCVEKGTPATEGTYRELTESTDRLSDKIDDLTVIANHGYWGDIVNDGSYQDSDEYKTTKAAMEDYFNSLTDAQCEQRYGHSKAEMLNGLTCRAAATGTQWALWLTTDPDKINHMALTNSKYDAVFVASATALKDTLLWKTTKEEAEKLDTPVTAKGNISELAVKSEATGSNGEKKTTDSGSQVYNAEMDFTVELNRSALNGDPILTVTGMNGKQAKFRLDGGKGGYLASLAVNAADALSDTTKVKVNSDGSYTLEGIEIADGVTVKLNVTGVQDIGDGVVIYESTGEKNLQDFISLSSKTYEVNLEMSLKFTDLENTSEGLTKSEKGAAARTDTKQVQQEKFDTRTDKTDFYSIVSDPGKKTVSSVSDLTIEGQIEKMTLTSKLTKEFEPIDYTFTPTPIDEEEGPGGGVPMLLNLDIPDEPVPMVHEPGVGIPDEGVPLADAPATGDASLIWAAMSVMSMGGYVFLGKKEKKANKGGKYLKK